MPSFNDPHKADLMQGVSLRGKVTKLVDKDVEQAYGLAKTIKHPWYRCQSLAKVAEFSEHIKLRAMLQESFNSAMLCHDENRRVSVACWPLEVAIRRGEKDLAAMFLRRCEQQIKSDRDIISKWCSVRVLYTIKKDTDLLASFFDTFSSATSQGHGWRVEKRIKYLLSDVDVQKDQRYINHLHQRKGDIEKWKNENERKGSG
jgi:hypothetical protein